ncbi:ankyrin repeat domain-containing protein [Alkalilimnicola ehrlichii]|uniref:Uncharacterized protein n=1 Tax=Alkalilimnicola ehrlichii TaxID=351052 RepID=A0A3E0WIU0_9GAMM|nr:ankyrin repeat domain-containing protein [Alkalilimnicola ehrlichii]RFA32698.1 hypothetical protein CAL65_19030 [Alkalilimnicola ehrlichii]
MRVNGFVLLLGLLWLTGCASTATMPGDIDTAAWFQALNEGDAAYLERQLQRGVPADLRRQDGWSSLELAITQNNRSLAKLLLEHGADPHGTTHNGDSILFSAVYAGDPELVRQLLKKGPASNNGTGTVSPRRSWPGHGAMRKYSPPYCSNGRNGGALTRPRSAPLPTPGNSIAMSTTRWPITSLAA